MKKLLLTLLLLFSVGIAASAKQVTLTPLQTTDGNFSIITSKGNGSSVPLLNTTESRFQLYAQNKLIVSSNKDGLTILSIKFHTTPVSGKGINFLTGSKADAGTFDMATKTWTGNASSVTITNGDESVTQGVTYIEAVEIEYTTSAPGPNPDPDPDIELLTETLSYEFLGASFSTFLVKSNGTNTPNINFNKSRIQLYAQNKLTISAKNSWLTIRRLRFNTANNTGYTNFLTDSKANVGTFDVATNTWTGNASNVTITNGGEGVTNGGTYIESIEVEYTRPDFVEFNITPIIGNAECRFECELIVKNYDPSVTYKAVINVGELEAEAVLEVPAAAAGGAPARAAAEATTLKALVTITGLEGTTYSSYTASLKAGHDKVPGVGKTENFITTGIDSVTIDAEVPVEYYSLQGIRVKQPEAGRLYIKRHGAKAEKVRF